MKIIKFYLIKPKRLVSILLLSLIVLLCVGCDNLPEITDKDFSNITYIALGDSITYGIDGMNSGKRMRDPYPSLVKKQLRLKSVNNYGISGSTLTAGVLNSYEPMSLRYNGMEDADIISVLGGVNDYLNNIPLGTIEDRDSSTIYGALRVLCNGLRIKFSNSFIFFMTPYKVINKPINELGYTLEDVANAIKEVCTEFSMPVLDLYNTGCYELEAEKSNSDKLHPSQKFIKEFTAPQISKFIADSYEF